MENTTTLEGGALQDALERAISTEVESCTHARYVQLRIRMNLQHGPGKVVQLEAEKVCERVRRSVRRAAGDFQREVLENMSAEMTEQDVLFACAVSNAQAIIQDNFLLNSVDARNIIEAHRGEIASLVHKSLDEKIDILRGAKQMVRRWKHQHGRSQRLSGPCVAVGPGEGRRVERGAQRRAGGGRRFGGGN